MKVKAEDLWPLILHFIQEYMSEDDLQKFQEYFKLSSETLDENPLVKAGGMSALVASFLKQNKKVFKKFKEHINTTKDSTGKAKKLVGLKRKASEVSELSAMGTVKRRRASSICSVASETEKKAEPQKKMKPVDFVFARVDPRKYVGSIPDKFMDNSFEAKEKYGKGGDSYGGWSNSKLNDKQGKNFIKEKNKMKNRNSHASGRFDTGAINSIKF